MGLSAGRAQRMLRGALSSSTPVAANFWIGLIPSTTGFSELSRASYQRAPITSSNYRFGSGTDTGKIIFDANEADFVTTANNLTGEAWGSIAQFGIYTHATISQSLIFHDRLRDPSTGVATSVNIASGGAVNLPAGQSIECDVRPASGNGFIASAANRAIRALFSAANPTIRSLWVAFMTSATAELNKASYQRAALSSTRYSLSGGRLTINAGSLDFVSSANDVTTESWGTLTHWGLYDSSSGGTLIYVDNLRGPDGSAVTRLIPSGGTATIPAGQYIEFPSTFST